MSELLSAILTGLSCMSWPTLAKPTGKYSDAAGTTSIDCLPGKTLVVLPRAMAPFTVHAGKGKVTIKNASGEITFTYRAKDDTFRGPGGVVLWRKA